MPFEATTRYLSKAIIVLALAYAVGAFFIFPKWAVDDAYITARYAENLALHGELTWNIGEKPIEGYTGFLLPVLLAGAIKMNFSPIVASHAIGIFSFFLGMAMLYLILKKLNISDLVSSITILLYSTMPVFFTHALSGLETMLFLASISVSLYFLVANNKSIFFFLSLLVTGLVRPEGVAFALPALLVSFFIFWFNDRKSLKTFFVKFSIFYLLPALIYFLWRLSFYGALLPNTFYAKRGSGFSIANLVDISRFIRQYFDIPILLALFFVAISADKFWKFIKEEKFIFGKHLKFFLVSAIFILLLLAVLLTSHLLVNYSARFYMPVVLPIWVAFAYISSIGLGALKENAGDNPLRYKAALLLFLALVFYQAIFQISKLPPEIKFAKDQIALQESEHNAIGAELKKIIPPSEWMLVYMDAGAIPYFSQLKAIDFGALNDPVLARGKLSESGRIDYFFSKNPAALVFTSMSGDKLDYGKEPDLIAADKRFKNYTLYKKYISPMADLDYNEFVYLRKDLYHK